MPPSWLPPDEKGWSTIARPVPESGPGLPYVEPPDDETIRLSLARPGTAERLEPLLEECSQRVKELGKLPFDSYATYEEIGKALAEVKPFVDEYLDVRSDVRPCPPLLENTKENLEMFWPESAKRHGFDSWLAAAYGTAFAAATAGAFIMSPGMPLEQFAALEGAMLLAGIGGAVSLYRRQEAEREFRCPAALYVSPKKSCIIAGKMLRGCEGGTEAEEYAHTLQYAAAMPGGRREDRDFFYEGHAGGVRRAVSELRGDNIGFLEVEMTFETALAETRRFLRNGMRGKVPDKHYLGAAYFALLETETDGSPEAVRDVYRQFILPQCRRSEG